MHESKNPKSYIILLNAARGEITKNDFQQAVVLAQTASELFAEQVFDYLFKKRQIDYLQRPVERLLYRNFNFAHGKVVGLYEALANDRVTKTATWSNYKEHTELRNDVVHQGRDVTREQAERSLNIVENLIRHICGATGMTCDLS